MRAISRVAVSAIQPTLMANAQDLNLELDNIVTGINYVSATIDALTGVSAALDQLARGEETNRSSSASVNLPIGTTEIVTRVYGEVGALLPAADDKTLYTRKRVWHPREDATPMIMTLMFESCHGHHAEFYHSVGDILELRVVEPSLSVGEDVEFDSVWQPTSDTARVVLDMDVADEFYKSLVNEEANLGVINMFSSNMLDEILTGTLNGHHWYDGHSAELVTSVYGLAIPAPNVEPYGEDSTEWEPRAARRAGERVFINIIHNVAATVGDPVYVNPYLFTQRDTFPSITIDGPIAPGYKKFMGDAVEGDVTALVLTAAGNGLWMTGAHTGAAL